MVAVVISEASQQPQVAAAAAAVLSMRVVAEQYRRVDSGFKAGEVVDLPPYPQLRQQHMFLVAHPVQAAAAARLGLLETKEEILHLEMPQVVDPAAALLLYLVALVDLALEI